MAPRLPLDRLLTVPADVIAAVRLLPAIAENTRAMRDHTATLHDVAQRLKDVSSDTGALPDLRENMGRVAETTSILEPMDARMATIADSMPILVEVQQHLSKLPETIGALDERIAHLSILLERMLDSLDGMTRSVESLDAGVGPLSRLARRLPGGNRTDDG